MCSLSVCLSVYVYLSVYQYVCISLLVVYTCPMSPACVHIQECAQQCSHNLSLPVLSLLCVLVQRVCLPDGMCSVFASFVCVGVLVKRRWFYCLKLLIINDFGASVALFL